MDFAVYSKRFRRSAFSQGLTEKEVERCLTYASALASNGLPVIYDCYHFASLVGYDLQYLYGAANCPERFYRHFSIPKKNGTLREISEPLPSLKEIQRWLLDNILYKVSPSDYAKAFRPGYSIVDNARFHLRQDKVIVLDLRDFFPSITFPRIYVQFKTRGYHDSLCVLFAKLCCLDGRLPQGAPTSPALSNLVAGRMDRRIVGYTMSRQIRYTRYADDLAFSNVRDVGGLMAFVQYCVRDGGFSINENKTRVIGKHNRQMVTGIVVNRKLSPPRDDVKRMRQVMYYVGKFGMEGHQHFTHDERPWFLSKLEGTVRFMAMVGLGKTTATRWLRILRKIRRGK